MAEIAHYYDLMGLHKHALTNGVDICAQVDTPQVARVYVKPSHFCR